MGSRHLIVDVAPCSFIGEETMEIEKNDIDLSKLFMWSSEVSVLDAKGEELTKVFMRVVGDKDLSRARVFSLRESAELRKSLNTEGTDEYEAFISSIEYATPENIVVGIKLLMIQDLVAEARKSTILKYPKEPDSDAPLAEHEAYQKEVDEFPENFDEIVQKETDKLMDREEKRFKAQNVKTKKKEYANLMTNYVCQTEASRRFTDMCVFFATYNDEGLKIPAFKSFEEYDNSAGELKEQLRDSYEKLDMGMGQIKKLQEATQ